MKYTRDQFLGDLMIAETFEGTPEEIMKLIEVLDKGEPEENNRLPIYGQEEAIEFIKEELKDVTGVDEMLISAVLNAGEGYMRSKGIVER